jgi:3-hydroxybutyrate dehydrogenase
MPRLDDKVAFITGAASGIGKAIAIAFAQAGARIIVADQHALAADETAAAIAQAGGRARGIGVDVTDEAEVEAAVQAGITTYGGIDILVSNAGIQIVHPLVDFTFAEWKRMLAVHLDGAFLTTRACMRHMIARQRGGSIIYMGSVHSKTASASKAPYVTANHGLMGLTRAVAKEGAPHHIRANMICPGFVRTPLVDGQIPALARAHGLSETAVITDVMLKDTVDGEFTTTADVADVALLFASFPTDALTGQSLIVSHGWVME